MAHKLSVLIPCKDEEHNIRACIEAVKDIADELVIADSGSTDRTIEIAKEYDIKLIEREYINSADFKNWAIPQLAHDWVLVVDSDERVTAKLAKEIKSILAQETPKFDGYRIRRDNHFLGHRIRHAWGRDYTLRLFRKSVSKYQERRVHSDVIVSTGKVGKAKARFLHYSYWDAKAYLFRMNRYSTWASKDLYEKGRRASMFTILVRPAFRFFKHYILQLGFLDGRFGLIYSLHRAYYVFVKYSKLWGYAKGMTQEQAEERDKKYL